MAAFKAFKKTAITVILESQDKKYHNLISPLISGALRDPKVGNTIPILVASSPEGSRIWGQLSYAQIGSSKSLNAMVKELTAIQKGEKEPAKDIKVPLHWAVKNKPGYSYQGDFVKLNGNKLYLRKEDREFSISLDKITPNAASFAKKLAGLEDHKIAEASMPTEEDWTNSKGKTIVATFIALRGAKITLKLANGKTSTFPLNLLSEDHIKRAKEYAN